METTRTPLFQCVESSYQNRVGLGEVSGLARMCQVMGNFFGGSPSLGIGEYTADRQMDPDDNGIYAIEGWSIADHLRTGYGSVRSPIGMRSHGPSEKQDWREFGDMLRSLDSCGTATTTSTATWCASSHEANRPKPRRSQAHLNQGRCREGAPLRPKPRRSQAHLNPSALGSADFLPLYFTFRYNLNMLGLKLHCSILPHIQVEICLRS